MKWYSGILLFVMAAWMLASCGSRADRPSLVAADSLILHDPDSACAVLEAYPADSLTADGDRAYHALLTTIARYKAYRPATTDSLINIAVGHYDRSGADPDRRMRSLLYKGCVMEELGDPEQAIEYYKRAETACPATDYFHTGYINMRMASLYQSAYSDSIVVGQFKKAAQLFQKTGDKHYEAICLISAGMQYFHLENYDSAAVNLNTGISLAKETRDSTIVFDGYESLCHMYYGRDMHKEVIETSEKLFGMSNDTIPYRTLYDIVSISFSKLGYPDSAEKYLKIAPGPVSVEDSISEMRAIAELALARADLRTYIQYNEIAVDKSDSLLIASQADKIREAEAKYDMAQNEVANLTKQRHLIFIIATLSILVVVVGFCVLIYQRREKNARMELEEAISQVSTSRLQLEQVLHENQNRLSELRAQEEQLRQMQLLMDQMRDVRNDGAVNIEDQLSKTNQALDAAETSIKIQDQTLICLDEILRTVFYSGRYNSDQIIDNDSILNMKPEFWENLYKLVSLKHDDVFARIEAKGIELNENEKKLIALSAANLPRAIIRRILDCKNIQVVSNRRQKLAKKITGRYTNFDEIFR